MALSAWPATLPQHPLRDGFTEQRQPNVVAFKPDVGPPKTSRRSTAAGTLTAASFILTPAQKADFEEFYEATLADGTLPFLWDHPQTAVPYIWLFDPENVPEISPRGRQFRLNCRLIRLP